MRTRSRAAALLICLAAVAAGGASAGAAEGKDVLELRALTWHEGGDVRITVPAGEGGAAIGRFEHVQVRMTPPGAAEPTRVLNRKDVEAEQGVAGVPLGEVERGTKVEVQVHVREDESPRTTILRGDAIARLRPDLVVAAVYAPEQTLSTRAVDVVADIEELNDETGATATLTLMLGPTAVAEPKTVTVAAGATKPVTFEGVKLETAMTAKLTVRVERRRAVRDRRDEQHALAHDRGDRARARPRERARRRARRLRRPVQPARVRARDQSPGRVAAGHGGEGQGARAAARPHLLQRRLRGAAAEPSAQSRRRSSTPSSSPTRPAPRSTSPTRRSTSPRRSPSRR